MKIITQAWTVALGLTILLAISGCETLPEHARTNKLFEIETPENLSPPIVEREIHDCGEIVYVSSFMPGALVQVWVNGVEEVGIATPHYGFAEISLTRPLAIGEVITATQTVSGVTSLPSLEPVTVEAWSDDFEDHTPEVVPDVWECGRIVDVAKLVDSCRVKVYEDGALRGQAESPGTWKDVFTNQGLTKNLPIRARQFACEDDPAKIKRTDLSPKAFVKPFPAGNFNPPVIDENTVIPGNDSVTLRELFVGAKLAVSEDGNHRGGGYANGTANWVPLNTPLTANGTLTAKQELCEVSDEDKGIPVEGRLPTLEIVGPVCNDDLTIRVRGGVVNANVVVLQNGSQVGSGGAQPGSETILAVSGLVPGLVLTVVQYLGDTTLSDVSDPVTVCCCADACYDDYDNQLSVGSDFWDAHAPAICPATNKMLFTSGGPHDIFEFEVMANWDAVNNPNLTEANKDQSVSDGTLSYVDSNNQTISLPVTVNGRGHSRFDHCLYKPLKIDFGSKQDNNIFDGHKKIKLVTHCGNHPNPSWFGDNGEPVLGGTPEVQRRRLLAEYYFYRIFQEQDSAGLSVRLGRMTYKNLDGSTRLTELVFWREREDDACERCGWDDEAEDNDVLNPDDVSVFQVDMYNKFVYNNDYSAVSGHNTVKCKDLANNGFYIPYDWDLTGVIRPDYWKNVDNNGMPINYIQNAPEYRDFLGTATPQVRSKIQGWYIIQHDDEMKSILENSLLDNKGKALMLGWYDLYMRILKCYVGHPQVLVP